MNNIQTLPHHKEWAIIINCGTSVSATLSILSVLRYCDMPLLVIDCALLADIENVEYRRLQMLQGYCKEKSLGDFSLLQLPLKKHGYTLDYIFENLKAEYILLVDSDLEVLNDEYLTHMRKWICTKGCFGAGFFHGADFGFNRGRWPEGFYKERMWIPFSLLSVEYMREAIGAGYSFIETKEYNDFPVNQTISRYIYKLTTKLHISLKWNPFRRIYGNKRPNFVMADTGGNIYEYLRNKKYFFAGSQFGVYKYYCKHYDGCTRFVLDNDNFGTNYNEVSKEVLERLQIEYKFNANKYYRDI